MDAAARSGGTPLHTAAVCRRWHQTCVQSAGLVVVGRCGSTWISAACDTFQQTPVGSVASWWTVSLNEED